MLAAVFLSSSWSIRPFIQKPAASEEALGSALKAQGMFIWGRGWDWDGKCDISRRPAPGRPCLWSPGCMLPPSGLLRRGSLPAGSLASPTHRGQGLPLPASGPHEPAAICTPTSRAPPRRKKRGCGLVHLFSLGYIPVVSKHPGRIPARGNCKSAPGPPIPACWFCICFQRVPSGPWTRSTEEKLLHPLRAWLHEAGKQVTGRTECEETQLLGVSNESGPPSRGGAGPGGGQAGGYRLRCLSRNRRCPHRRTQSYSVKQ